MGTGLFRIEPGMYDFTLVGHGNVWWMDDPDAKEDFPPLLREFSGSLACV